MTLEIKTSNLEPIRQTYAYIERRFGKKPATRYQEVSFDVQGATNFHYRPLWKPDKILNDYVLMTSKIEDIGDKNKLEYLMNVYEKIILESALSKHSSMRKAARTLGIDPSTLSRKAKKYNINL